MSFILDALRRADADRARERAGVPGLHDQAPPVMTDALSGADDALGAEASARPWRWLLPLAMGLGGVAVAAWWLAPVLRSSAPAATVAALPAPVAERVPGPAPAVQPVSPMPPAQPLPSASLPPAQPPANAATPPAANAAGAVIPPPPGLPGATGGQPPLLAGAAQQPTGPVPLPVLLPDPPGRVQPRPDPSAPLLQPQLPGGADPAPPVPDASTGAVAAPVRPPATAPTRPANAERNPSSPVEAAPAATIPWLRELPAALRRELPALSVNGAVHSPEPASRMLVLDGQVVREGHNVAGSAQPGLVLEQIGPKAALFSYKGQRFQVPY